MLNRKRLLDRFIKYTKIDTRSVPGVEKLPSSPGQIELAKIVLADMKDAGFQELEMDDKSFIFGTIPANLPTGKKAPTVGFLAHLDTTMDNPGGPTKVRFIENYKGDKITYPAKPGLELSPENSPLLKTCTGHTLITSDGTTVLGVDDKIGIALIIELGCYFKEHPEIHHGKIRVSIVPDEETSVGVEQLDLKKFGADVVYVADGTELGEMMLETWNAYKANISIAGSVSHPGTNGKNYNSAAQILAKFVASMDERRWPQNSSGREQMWLVDNLKGSMANASADVYLRSFDLEGIEEQKKALEDIRQKLLKEFGLSKISIETKFQYSNYKEDLDKDPRIIAFMEEAMKRVGVEPKRVAIRAGTDACNLCKNGLLSTSVFVGEYNPHCLNEWTSIEVVESSFKTMVELVQVWFEKGSS